MIELSPKIKMLIIGAAVMLAAIVVAVIVMLVGQKAKVAKISSISFENANEQMMVGEQREFAVTIYPSNSKNKALVFSSSNENVLRVVSSSENTVLVEAKAAGQAQIVAHAKANKKIEDSCNIQVSDNMAEGLGFETYYVSGRSGESKSVEVVLTPQSSNYQKIKILAFTSSVIKNPAVVVGENSTSATIDFLINGVGDGQILVGFMADQNGDEVVIMQNQINVHGDPAEIGELSFVVKSNNHTTYIGSESSDIAETGTNFLLSTENIFDFKIKEGNSYVVADNVVYNNSIFDVIEPNEDKEYTINLKDGVVSGWGVANVVFEYQNKTLVLTFVEGSLSVNLNGETILQNPTDLKNGKTYLLTLSEGIQKLIYYGFAKMTLATSGDEVELDGQLLKCKKVTNGTKSFGFVLYYGHYWNHGHSDSVQKNIDIKIEEEPFSGQS